ncbi:hypothetical protein RJ641_027931 [Dillenia turbinata]|uniref:Uncharacterized protein n=1 Tax=Dillenia turbinata TaxID=194707 RepID=A0AAN8ZIJ9_9MAGN
MSRTLVLVSLVMFILFTSQLEWKQQGAGVDKLSLTSDYSKKRQHLSDKEEFVKEKIILSQEKSIQKLNELVRRLHEQLLHCRSSTDTNSTTTPLTELLSELEQHHFLED